MIRDGFRHGYSPDDWEAAKREAIGILSERASRRSDQTIAYSELTDEIKSIRLDPHGAPLAHMLGEISTEENAAGRGMLTVLVVHKGTIEPGPGFFVLAKSLGKDVRDKAKLWSEEFERVTSIHSKA